MKKISIEKFYKWVNEGNTKEYFMKEMKEIRTEQETKKFSEEYQIPVIMVKYLIKNFN